MTKVLVEDVTFQSFRMVDLDSSVDPLDNLVVIVRKHLRQLVEKLSDGVMLVIAVTRVSTLCLRKDGFKAGRFLCRHVR